MHVGPGDPISDVNNDINRLHRHIFVAKREIIKNKA